MTFSLRVAAVAVAGALAAGCGAIAGDDDASGPRPTDAPIGRAITVEGTVSRVVSGHVMIVDDPPDEIVVVVAEAPEAGIEGAVVRAEGRIRQFDTVAIERTLDVELDDEVVVEFLGLPCVVATEVEEVSDAAGR